LALDFLAGALATFLTFLFRASAFLAAFFVITRLFQSDAIETLSKAATIFKS
jgi:hypothetical protein